MTIHQLGRSVALLLAISLCSCKPQAPSGVESDLAVLAQGASGYAQARPGVRLVFPRDHGAHPDFRITAGGEASARDCDVTDPEHPKELAPR